MKLRAILPLLSAICAAVSSAQPPPVLPCGASATFPIYSEAGAPPNVEVWERAGLGANWSPPECTGWKTPGFAMLVVTAGRFRAPGDQAALLRRLGAISALQGIRYWSTTHQKWRTLISSSSALEGSTGARHRKDFTPDELTAGRNLYFEQEDNLTGRATYELRIRELSADRMVFETENVTTMKYFFVPVFHPREMQSIYFLDRDHDDVWRLYGIARTGPGASGLATGHDASSINRAVAFYRHLAGIPTDQEPPPAR